MSHATLAAPPTGPVRAHADAAAERREWVRYPSNLDAICWFAPGHDGEPWGAAVEDISAGGLGLIAREAVPVGATIFVKLHSDYVNLSGALAAQVVSAKAINREQFLLGCKFLEPLGERERRTLL